MATMRRRFRELAADQRAITGLETAIILIAFVIVASVFAYTVLTAGIFASQKANESVNAAVDEVLSSIVVGGNTIAFTGAVDIDGDTATDDTVDAVVRISLTLAVALQGTPIDLTPAYRLSTSTLDLEASGLVNSLAITYIDKDQVISNMAWTVDFGETSDGDYSLESTEKATVTVWLVDHPYDATTGLYYKLGEGPGDPFLDAKEALLGSYDAFSLEISPVQGAPLSVEKVIPQSLNPIMNLR